MARTPPEWIGKDDDTPVPPRVRLRVLRRFEYTCYRSGRPIRPNDSWQCDHVIAIINGGANRESNLAPILAGKASPNSVKTAEDVAIKKKTEAIAKRNFGLKQSKRPMPCGRNSKYKKTMDGRVVLRNK